MHHFQLKPVRSLDSLRPAWSGHLRHGPPPSTAITNPRKVSPVKRILSSSSSHPLSQNSSVDHPKPFTSNSMIPKPSSSTVETETLSSSALPHDQNAQPNRLLHELHAHSDSATPAVNLSSIREKESARSEGKFPLSDKRFSPNVFARADPVPNIWDEPFDRSFKTSNFLHEANEDDPFDTSRVFTPTYLQQAAPLFKSMIPSTPAQFHPLSYPSDATSCSAQAKVNIIVHYLFYICKTFRSILVRDCWARKVRKSTVLEVFRIYRASVSSQIARN